MRINQNFENFSIIPQNYRRFTIIHRKKILQQAKIVANYRIGGKIGEGGNGHVYVASRIGNDKKFAVKILPKTQQNLIKLQKQIEILKSLSHENIVKYQQVIYQQNRIFIFMELCSKGDLFTYIKNNGQLSEDLSAQIFIKIYSAVLYLHQIGITHRDIKAENILFDQNMNPKLIDFGFSRFYHKNQPFLETWCGSLNYIAPEILKKRKYKPQLIDLWSLAVTLYVMLTCKQPFNRQNMQNIAIKNYIIRFNWQQDQKLSKQAIQFFHSVFVPAQHRISLQQVKNTAFYNKYTNFSRQKHLINLDCSQKIITEQQTTHSQKKIKSELNKFLTITLDTNYNSEYSDFPSQDIETTHMSKNKIQFIKSLRRQNGVKSVEPRDKFRIKKTLKKNQFSKNDLNQYN